ncbi:MAG: glutamine--fructose-6-phosphate aminotransferase, partial [Vibrio toranzoniae]
TEVIAHLVEWELRTSASLVEALQKTAKQLEGAYGTVAVDRKDPSRIVVARSGSPIVIGFGVGENFLASDQLALLSVTRRFMYLEEGDVAEVTRRDVTVFDVAGERVERDIVESNAEHDAGDKGQYRHFMQKEIFEQPTALINTMEGRISETSVTTNAIGVKAEEILSKVEHVQ